MALRGGLANTGAGRRAFGLVLLVVLFVVRSLGSCFLVVLFVVRAFGGSYVFLFDALNFLEACVARSEVS